MEVLIGFAVGYWLGTRQGRQGLARTMDSAREIATSPEAKHLLGESIAAAAPLAGSLGKRGGKRGFAAIRGVIDELAERRGNHQAQAA